MERRVHRIIAKQLPAASARRSFPGGRDGLSFSGSLFPAPQTVGRWRKGRSLTGEGKTVVCPCLFAPVLKQSDGRGTDNPRGGMNYLPHESVFFTLPTNQRVQCCKSKEPRSEGKKRMFLPTTVHIEAM